jgi:hypothetical protein
VKFLIAVILLCVFHSLKFVQMSSVIQPSSYFFRQRLDVVGPHLRR